ncbi:MULTISPECIES: hypothetical protein [Pseudomonadota]|uniref:Uncharacterized protein n=2 Tax=Pseudomonas TaxID=286 RepID=A0A1G7UQ65_9PSED|nr:MULTISPECIES: hypothetical protein [Pseudomonadota]MDF8361337.1 hypothetical protein [Achromobacter anxifer]NMY08889.1 hypothetical protein [Pseudomonas veronii]SDG49381.1 hypothetical protein SAMN05216605_102236 [Pseudomonas abietaniphila]
MSQHYFETNYKDFPITVILGWDRPMQHVFLVIRKPPELVDETLQVLDENFLYSNLYEKDPFGHDLDYYREVLRHFQISVPESMFNEVEHDAVRNVGNRFVKHGADGSLTELSS